MNRPRFSCPVHKLPLDNSLYCTHCARSYPLVNGIPILLNEANSVFSISDYISQTSAYRGASSYAGYLDQRTGIRQGYRRLMHRIAESVPYPQEFGVQNAISHVQNLLPDAQILVIGSGDKVYDGHITYTDVAFGKSCTCIADAHDLPFENQSFDACIACAVLEHVADPQRCVSEIQRVLRPSGFVYSETPFMQPVHMGAHDFTRFTYLGHRRLFRNFDLIHSGIAGGPGTSAALIFRHLLLAFTNRPFPKKLLRMIGLLVTYPLRLLDLITRSRVAAYDSASAFYFFGTLRSEPISDREILKFYRGD